MKNSTFSKVFLITFLFFLILTTHMGEALIPCSTVNGKAASCLAYAMGKAPKPSAACCIGLQQLAQSVKAVDDKKAICRCLKAGAKAFTGMQDRFLSQIPTVCNIKVGFPVSISTNCETIH